MAKFLKALAKYTSRKFVALFAAELGAVVALFSTPMTGDKVTDAAIKIGALLALVAAAIGYAVIEGGVDKAALAARPEPPAETKRGAVDGKVDDEETPRDGRPPRPGPG